MSYTILLIEDNAHIMKINKDTLLEEEYDVLEARNLEEAKLVMQKKLPNLIVLDIMLPDGSGVDFCREVKKMVDIPVLFLSAKRANCEIVDGLRSGGDDYLTKPYDLDVLLARIEALLRRTGSKIQKDIKLGALWLNILSGKAYLEEEDLLLTQKEFAILLLLMENQGVTISKEEIFRQVWGCPMVQDSQALWITISRLKKKLSGSGFTIYGVRSDGYRLDFKDQTFQNC